MIPIGRQQLIPAVAVAVVLVLGIGLRFTHLGENLIWHDEVYTRIFAAGYSSDDWSDAIYSGEILDASQVRQYQHHNPERSVFDTVAGLARDEPQHPPLYYILARTWVSALGSGIALIRSLTVLMSLLAFPAIYWLSMELFRSRRVAWTAAALVALSPFFVLYAQEAREYTLWGVWTLLSSAALLRALRRTEDEPGPLWRLPSRGVAGAWGLYAGFTVLSLYTSFSTGAVIIAQMIYVALRGRLGRGSLHCFCALAVAGILFMPWAVILLQHFDAFQASMAWSTTIVVPRSELLATLGLNLSRSLIDFWPEYVHPATGPVVALAVAGIVAAFVWVGRKTPWHSSVLLLLVFAVPIALLLVPDLLHGGIRSVSTRYLTPCLLMVLLAVAAAVGTPRARAWLAPVATTAVLLLALASCIHNARQETVWTKGVSANLPRVAELINPHPGALVVGNRERHHPGNLLSLSTILDPGIQMQFLAIDAEASYVLPRHFEDVVLFSPTLPFRERFERHENVRCHLLYEDLYMDLWKVEFLDPIP